MPTGRRRAASVAGPMRAARLALLVAVVGGSAACGESSTVVAAALVDGVEIPQQAVVDELDAIGANDLYVQGYEALSGRPIFGTEDGTYDAAFVNETLALQIQYQIVETEVADRGVEIDDACRDEGETTAVNRLGGLSEAGDGQAVFDAFPETYRTTLVSRETSILSLVGDLIGVGCFDSGAARRYYDANPQLFASACASHILVETEAEALVVRQQLLDGADFAELAREVSTDPAAQQPDGEPGAGGDYGCFDASAGFVQPFLDAAMTQPVGEPGPPVATDFGFHVLLVRSREAQSFEQAEEAAQLAAETAADAAFSEFFTTATAEAVVEVDPRYGTWDPTARVIDRPVAGADGTDASTTTTAAG